MRPILLCAVALAAAATPASATVEHSTLEGGTEGIFLSGEIGVGNAVIGHYLSQLGLSEKAVIFATSASPYTISWLIAANSADADIGFEAAPPSLPRPPESFLALSGPLQKAQADPAQVAAAPEPGNQVAPRCRRWKRWRRRR